MKKRIKDIPDIDKPREKLISKGASALSNVELFAALIGIGFQGKDVLQIACEIEKEFKDRLHKTEYNDLIKIDGIGKAKACQILASFEIAKRYLNKEDDIKIMHPKDVLPFVREIRDKRQEHFICITLNGAKGIIEKRVVTVGLLNSSQIHPREIFSDAISDRAASVVLVHNHPSGMKEPGKKDIEITERLCEAGKILGIIVLDHIIVTKKGFSSMKEKGIIK